MNIMDKFSLKGKKAIVTGGARGLNHGMAEGLHEAGAEVVLFDIMDLVYESAEKMSTPEAPVHAVKGDVTDKESREKAFAEAIGLLGGRLDILINGAGIQYRCEAIDFPEDKFKQILDVNLVGLFYMAQLAAKVMIPQGYGHIGKYRIAVHHLRRVHDRRLYCKQGRRRSGDKGYVHGMGRSRHQGELYLSRLYGYRSDEGYCNEESRAICEYQCPAPHRALGNL